jgi:hypothetical protein
MGDDCSVFRVECDYEAALIVQSNRMVNFGVEKRTIKRAPLNRDAIRTKLKRDMSSVANQPSMISEAQRWYKPIDVSTFHFSSSIRSNSISARPTLSVQERMNRWNAVVEATTNNENNEEAVDNESDDDVPEIVPFDTDDNDSPTYGCITAEDLPPLEDDNPDLVDIPGWRTSVPINSEYKKNQSESEQILMERMLNSRQNEPIKNRSESEQILMERMLNSRYTVDRNVNPIKNPSESDQYQDEVSEILNSIFESDESDNDLFIDADDPTEEYDEPEITYKGYSARYWNYGIKHENNGSVAIVIGRKS